MKIFANALALSMLLALLAACGDESSSSVSPEPRQCEEQNDDCNDASSSSEKISKNSSSSQKSADKGKSSSSEKNAKESSSSTTTKNSSSSVDGDKSSSSVKKEDSSSSVVKASSSSATPKSSSSEEVKQSSSSVVASSSSVAVQSSSSSYDRTDAFKGTLWRAGAYKTFVDSRDNREYYYIEIAGEDTAGKAATIKVMAENLNVGEFVRGRKDQEDDTKIERYCYENDTTNCNKYGGLYQWAEMMQLPSRCNTESCADSIKPNHQGICPDGWRLLTYNDLYIVIHSSNNKYGVEGIRSAYGFGGSNDTGYSLIGAGYSWDHSFRNVEEGTYWYYPQESSVGGDLFVYASAQNNASKGNAKDEVYKIHGFSVRCVMVE
ncbi:fibrobacter succinogenes major paralogous domain-containing protein [Candidatus Saccharibacteria bacterium]|nr:fibrobacter succinogenes major paralogous domain-containing protein [Candidatus Saccharibacteria bacterium]